MSQFAIVCLTHLFYTTVLCITEERNYRANVNLGIDKLLAVFYFLGDPSGNNAYNIARLTNFTEPYLFSSFFHLGVIL